jgi:hypothetical protein
MTDYNPDREGHKKHKFYVRNATKRKFDTLTVDGKDMKFSDKGRMMIKDEKLAREIQVEYPDDLAVTRVRQEDGHRTFFSMPQMPWKREKETEVT